MTGVVIVGGGIAGQAVCEALRERDSDMPITLVCGEPHLPCDRVRLSDVLVTGEDPEVLALRPPEWYEDRSVSVRLGRWVEHVDLDERVVRLDGDELLPYAQLVLATARSRCFPRSPASTSPASMPFAGRRTASRSARAPPARATPSSSAAACSGWRRRAVSQPRDVRSPSSTSWTG